MWARGLPCTVTSSPRVSHTRPDLPAPHPTAAGHGRPPITPASFVHSELRAPGPVTSQVAGTSPALISFLGTPQPISGPPPPLSSAPLVCAPCPKACFPQPADSPTEWSCLLAAISPRTVLPSHQVPFESLRHARAEWQGRPLCEASRVPLTYSQACAVPSSPGPAALCVVLGRPCVIQQTVQAPWLGARPSL